jgi:hypothetical protein
MIFNVHFKSLNHVKKFMQIFKQNFTRYIIYIKNFKLIIQIRKLVISIDYHEHNLYQHLNIFLLTFFPSI